MPMCNLCTDAGNDDSQKHHRLIVILRHLSLPSHVLLKNQTLFMYNLFLVPLKLKPAEFSKDDLFSAGKWEQQGGHEQTYVCKKYPNLFYIHMRYI